MMVMPRKRSLLPYGKWTCADGREVLFNRSYSPIYQRMPGSAAVEHPGGEWVKFVKQEWFYNDLTPRDERTRRAMDVLSAWGITPTAPASPLDAVPIAGRGR